LLHPHGPRRHLPKFANGLCRYLDVLLYLDRPVIWQANKNHAERSNANGVVSHDDAPYIARYSSLLTAGTSLQPLNSAGDE
jgi:hypothetical protein